MAPKLAWEAVRSSADRRRRVLRVVLVDRDTHVACPAKADVKEGKKGRGGVVPTRCYSKAAYVGVGTEDVAGRKEAGRDRP